MFIKFTTNDFENISTNIWTIPITEMSLLNRLVNVVANAELAYYERFTSHLVFKCRLIQNASACRSGSKKEIAAVPQSDKHKLTADFPQPISASVIWYNFTRADVFRRNCSIRILKTMWQKENLPFCPNIFNYSTTFILSFKEIVSIYICW